MESLKELYKIGVGPSSSHTMGPRNICLFMKQEYPHHHDFRVTLYGSLALTGKGHLTDVTIKDVFKDDHLELVWKKKESLPFHPNGMKIELMENQQPILEKTFYSIGGGSFVEEGQSIVVPRIYKEKSLKEILDVCRIEKLSFYEYVKKYEKDIDDYLSLVLETMFTTVERGLTKTGIIPGKLKLSRVAKSMYLQALESPHLVERETMLLSAYAYATSEENASGGQVVTAPTCGACGIVPAVLYYAYKQENYSKQALIEALATGGIIGNLVKTNATISGADGGCQAEVGTACSMAAAMYASLLGLNQEAIGYAAEMALEHNLGLTCDPVGGYVQIPCIERNGFGALRARNAAIYAKGLAPLRKNRVSFDMVVNVMKETGHDLNHRYKETSLGGLAKNLVVEDE